MSESITLNPCLAIKVLLQTCLIRVSSKKSAKKLASALSYLRSSRNPKPLLDLPLRTAGAKEGDHSKQRNRADADEITGYSEFRCRAWSSPRRWRRFRYPEPLF